MNSLQVTLRLAQRAIRRASALVLDVALPLLLVLLLWELSIRSGLVRFNNLPAPSFLLGTFWRLTWGTGVLGRHLLSSAYRLVAGYSLAVLCGLLTGVAISSNGIIRATLSPLLSLLVSVPTIAWMPALLLAIGLGDRTVVAMVFLGSFFAISYNTIRGIELVDKNQIHVARLMGFSGSRLLLEVLLPGALPSLITGLRLGIGYSWRALVAGEMLAAMVKWGIGTMVYQARFWNDVATMMVGLLIIGLSGLLLDRGPLQWLEQSTVVRWGMVDGTSR